jgi:hypothetical protein
MLRSRRIEARTADSDGLLADVSGILLLLTSAKRSLETYDVSVGCIEKLRRCIAGIQMRYDLQNCEFDDDTVWNRARVDGIVRLLEYVQGEVRDKLNDEKSAHEIKICIDHLTSLQPMPRKRWWEAGRMRRRGQAELIVRRVAGSRGFPWRR